MDIIILAVTANGEVAQLARAFGSYPKGHVFESHLRYQQKNQCKQLVSMDTGYFNTFKLKKFKFNFK